MAQVLDWHLARALLEWQTELGVTEAIGSQPVDRLSPEGSAPLVLSAPSPRPAAPPVAALALDDPSMALAVAQDLADAAGDLSALARALAAFDGCDLKRGAQTCVFADGNPKARVMIVGEGPGAEEDRAGLPFVGKAGQLLDRMFGAIGLARTSPDPVSALYITNTVPWRPPGNREPTPAELAVLRPFLLRHIALAQPEVLVLMGNVACTALMGQRGILKLRGRWVQVQGLPALPMLHPAYLLRSPEAKRDAWADLIALKARLLGLA